jgi:hypothetical protein
MSDQQSEQERQHQHPVGTLVIVGIYALLFVLGWLAVYFLIFRARGAILP